MLTVIRDERGALQAACDWWMVDTFGLWTPTGDYVWLNQLEINPGVNLHTVRRHLVEEIGRLVPHAIGVYWERRSHGVKRVHAFRREQLQQLCEEVRV